MRHVFIFNVCVPTYPEQVEINIVDVLRFFPRFRYLFNASIYLNDMLLLRFIPQLIIANMNLPS